jgi:hypothetical protein
MSRDLLRYLSERIQEEQQIIADDLARGTAKDHGEYKYACGIIRGLMVANGLIAETVEKMENDDD